MITFIDQKQAFRLNSNFELEKLENQGAYTNSDTLVSLTEKFCIKPNRSTTSTEIQLLPVYPNESIQQNLIHGLDYQVDFTVRNTISSNKVHHISEFIQRITSSEECKEKTCVTVVILKNKAIVICKRLQEYLHFSCFQFDNPTELLYQLNAIYLDKGLDRETDPLVFKGEIREDSQIIHLIKIYFRNISCNEPTQVYKVLIDQLAS